MPENLSLNWQFEPLSNDLKIVVSYPSGSPEAPQVQIRCRPTEHLEVFQALTLKQVADAYMREREHLKPSTLSSYRDRLRYVLNEYGDKPIGDIDADALAVFRSGLAQKHKPRTVNNIIGLLRTILRYALERGKSVTNPGEHLKRITEQHLDIDPFTQEELQRVFACIKPCMRQFYTCMVWTGARPSELAALRWRDISFEANHINVNKARVRGREGTPKTKNSKRLIPMFPPARVALEIQSEFTASDVHNYVFTTRNGTPLTKHLDLMWKRACLRAGVRHRPCYQLRHTFASMMLSAGESPAYVARVLGHSTVETLFRHYARWIPNAAQEDGKRFRMSLT